MACYCYEAENMATTKELGSGQEYNCESCRNKQQHNLAVMADSPLGSIQNSAITLSMILYFNIRFIKSNSVHERKFIKHKIATVHIMNILMRVTSAKFKQNMRTKYTTPCLQKTGHAYYVS